MPSVPRPGRPRRPARPRRPGRSGRIGSGASRGAARIVVLGDLMLDMVVVPARPLEPGTDVPGRVALVQGGSAANTARWLGRLGAQTSLIAAVGRDAAGRALVDAIRTRPRHRPRLARGRGPDRAGSGSSSSPAASAASWPTAAPPTCSRRATSGRPGSSARTRSTCRPTRCSASRSERPAGGRSSSRATRARSISVDLASIGPLLAGGRRAARGLVEAAAPDLLFATASEAEALLGGRALDGLLDVAAIAVVKRGAEGRHGPRPRRRRTDPPRGRHRAPDRDRHDRRRRRVRCRVPRRLVRVPARRAIRAGLAPARGGRRPSGGRAPAVDAAARAAAVVAGAGSRRVCGDSLCGTATDATRHQPRGLGRARRGPAGRRPRIDADQPRASVPGEPGRRPGIGGRRARDRRHPGDRRDPRRAGARRAGRRGHRGARDRSARIRPQGRPAEPGGGHRRWRVGGDDRLGDDDRRPCRGDPGLRHRRDRRRPSRRARRAATGRRGDPARGAHVAAPPTFDISSDLEELGRTAMAVVCAGPKAILDVPATLEYLETRGVPVVAVGQPDVARLLRALGRPRRRPRR